MDVNLVSTEHITDTQAAYNAAATTSTVTVTTAEAFRDRLVHITTNER